MAPVFSENKVVMVSMNGNLNQCMDVSLIYYYLELDAFVVGKKFGKLKEGALNAKGKDAFFNQVTVTLRHAAHNISVKLFYNGVIQVSGAKSKDEGLACIKRLLHLVAAIHGSDIVTVHAHRGLVVDGNYFVYGQDPGSTEWYKCGTTDEDYTKFVIHHQNMEMEADGTLVRMENTHRARLYNNRCQASGTRTIVLDGGRKHMSKFFQVDPKTLEMRDTRSGAVVGRVVYTDTVEHSIVFPDKIEAHFSVFRTEPDIDGLKMRVTNINSGFTMDFPESCKPEIASQILNETYHLPTSYHPHIYINMKIRYSFNGTSMTGVCECIHKCKCKCVKVMILFYPKKAKGKTRHNVTICGAKCALHYTTAYEFFTRFVTRHFDEITYPALPEFVPVPERARMSLKSYLRTDLINK